MIGLGWSGAEIHCQTLKESPRFELVAGVDPDPALRAKAESVFGIKTYETIDQMIRGCRVDCASVSVPTYLHYQVGKEVLWAGFT